MPKRKIPPSIEEEHSNVQKKKIKLAEKAKSLKSSLAAKLAKVKQTLSSNAKEIKDSLKSKLAKLKQSSSGAALGESGKNKVDFQIRDENLQILPNRE